MSFITADRRQMDIIGYSIDDFVEKESKARFIIEIVEKLNTKEIEEDYSEQGGEAFDPKIMLAIWFFSYSESETSTRKIENNCKKNLDYIYVSANLRPDHSTLSRFRKRHLGVIGKYFVEIIKMAREKGISEFKQIAIDGSKIRAVSSKKKSMKEATIARYIKAIESDIEKYMDEVSREEVQEEVAKLKNKKEKLEEAKRILQNRKEGIKKDNRESHQINIEETDAYMMEVAGKTSYPGYNAQLGVDTKTQLIVSAEVVQDRNDEKQFSRQHKEIEQTIGKSETREYVADGGYKSLEQLEYIAKNEIKAYVGNSSEPRTKEEIIKSNKKITRKDFRYDEDKDVYICPEGKELKVSRRENNNYFRGKKYRTKQCDGCGLMKLCLGVHNKNAQREIRRDDREIYAEMMNQKMKTEQAKKMLITRRTTVEPVIGNIKSNMRNSRFRLKGLKNVNGEFYLMCIGHNINKLYKMLVFIFFINIISRKYKYAFK
jgi:transposase